MKLGIERLVTVSCVLALCALPLMMWSLVHPRPVPIILAMSAGQALGTLSLLLFIVAVLRDLRAARVLGRGRSLPPPSIPPSSKTGAAPAPGASTSDQSERSNTKTTAL